MPRASAPPGGKDGCDDESPSCSSAVTPHLSRIFVFPVKSLDPAPLQRVQVEEGAGLVGDREYALFDARGQALNAKRLGAAMQSVRADFRDEGRSVALRAGGEQLQCEIASGLDELTAFFTSVFRRDVTIRRDARAGFPDDTEASGPTLLGESSIASVAAWFDLPSDEIRRRFRANLEIAGLEPFEEDLLFGPPGRPRPFRIGEVEFLGVNPCARCVVPSLDSRGASDERTLAPSRFASLRQRYRRRDSEIDAYDHYYRLAVNTVLAPGQGGRTLRVGDELVPIPARS